MDINIINPYIRIAIPSVLTPSFAIPRRVIYDHELIYVESGSFILVYDGKEYMCKKGNFIFLCPGVPHSFRSIGERVSQPHIHFDLSYRKESSVIPVSFKDISDMTDGERGQIEENRFAGFQKGPFVKISDTERFFALFGAIIGDGSGAMVNKARLIELIDMLIRDNYPECIDDKGDSGYDIPHQVKDFIDAGLGFNMNLDDFEKQFSYNKFYLEKRFKREFGIGLISYRNQVRMRLARELLKTHNVCETAEKMGYSSIYAFSRAYKLHYGVSPTKKPSKNAEELKMTHTV